MSKRARIPRLESWLFLASSDPYLAPELNTPKLVGRVYGHPDQARHPDGKQVQTSAVTLFNRGVVITLSGSRYRLGTVNEDFARFMHKNYPGWDAKNPMVIPRKEAVS